VERTVTVDAFRLDGKNAIVTGSHKGLGAAMAAALAQAGANIACNGRDPNPGSASREIQAFGRKTIYFAGDLADSKVCAALIDRTVAELGSIDILVNNAGIIRRAPAEEFSDEDWEAVIGVNLTAAFRLSQLAGRQMLKQGKGGKIVNIASILSFQGGIRVAAYAAAKGGIAQLTKALSNEWAARGINVNAIAPGYMSTDNTAALREDAVRNRQILERIPAGRWGDPQDLAGAVVFLCSSASDYVHGHVLVVDGGWLAR
jgi:2-dehydro-3-deoxy-D-gluconate 5-dehydrogenase